MAKTATEKLQAKVEDLHNEYAQIFDAKLKVVSENNALRRENNLLRVCLARTQEALVVALVGQPSAGRGNNGGSGGEPA